MSIQINSSDIHILEETLSKIKSLSFDVNSTLDRISKNSETAEKALAPISNRTKMFNTYSKNLTSSLSVIDEIKDYAKLTGECEVIIKSGPEKTGLINYIDALDRLRNAFNEMNKTQLKKFFKVIDKIELLIKNGNNQLKDYFQSILARSYEPFDVKEYIGSNASTPSSIRLPLLSHENLSIISQLFDYFNSTKQKVDDIYIDMATRHISTSLLPLNKAAKSTRTGNAKGQPYEKGTSPLNIYTSALGGFIIARAEDLSLIFANSTNDKLQVKLVEEVINLYLNDFISVINHLNEFVLNNMQTESLLIYEIVHNIVLIISTVQVILKVTPTNLSDLMTKVKLTARNVFVEFLRYIDNRVQSLLSLPSDNGVSEATGDILGRLRKLSDYRQSASASIENLTRDSWLPQPKPQWLILQQQNNSNNPINLIIEGPWSILSAFFSDAIDALIFSLESKAKSIAKKDSQQIGLLLLTNLIFVETTVKNTDMYSILSKQGADRILKLRRHGHDLFLESWKKISMIIIDSVNIKQVQNNKQQLTSKDREIIKDRFKTFNSEFEALLSKQKALNISDPHLRQELVREITRLLCPLYHRYYDKHIGGDFSKNVDKYIKYDKQQFDIKINSLA